jgi:CheY-like chemotaxis protein
MARILVVDDDKAVRAAIEIVLNHEGYEVVSAESGQAGVEAVTTSRFDAVLVDIFMPGMDGIETIKAFNARAPGTPIIAMSGFMFRDSPEGAPNFLQMATKLGAAYSLQKPFRPRELLKAVKTCLGSGATTASHPI